MLDPIVLFDETEAIATTKAMLTNIYEGTWNLKQKQKLMKRLRKLFWNGKKAKGWILACN